MSSLDQRAEAARPVGRWDEAPSALRAAGVVKRFGATHALRGANLALYPGEVHALVGENGAGKSTLVKILVGALQPDAGRLGLGGAPLRLASVRDAIAAGIVPVYQHLTLMPHLSVTENLFAFDLAAGAAFRGRPRRCTPADARAMLAPVGLAVDPHGPVDRLSLAERQLVEIARGLGRDCKVLVLDEPTAALNRAEVDRLFAALRRIRERGTAVLFISHKLGEIEEIADRVSVLRDGQSVLEGAPRAAVSSRELIELMIGHGVETGPAARAPAGAEVLRAEGLTAPGVFAGVSLAVRRGEILGLAGLVGAGALETAAALAGAFPVRQGSLRLDGRLLRAGDRVAAHRRGIALLPGEREEAGVFPGLSALTNASVSILGELAPLGWLRGRRERARILPWWERLRVTPTGPGLAIDRFSGGNQQKILAIRSLVMAGMRLLVALDPTRGVDVGARAVIHEALARAAAEGAAVVVFSSDLEELVALSHRIVAMREGRVVAEFAVPVATASVLAALTGAAA